MVNKREIAIAASKAMDCSIETAQDILNTYLGIIEQEILNGKDVNLVGFGKFSIVKRAAKKWVNPRTKESILVPAYSTVKFKVSVPFNDKVKRQFKV